MKFEELLQQRKVNSVDIVNNVRQRVESQGLIGAAAPVASDGRDFVRGYEPQVRCRDGGGVEIRLLTDQEIMAQGRPIRELTVNDIPVAFERTWAEPTAKLMPGGRTAFHVYISGRAADLNVVQASEASSFVVKGQLEDGPMFAALGTVPINSP